MSKIMPLDEAVSRYVHDGDVVYAAGFTHLIPFAAAHEIIRQGRVDLILARATPDLIYEQMVAAGCARKLIFSYMGNPGVGQLRSIREAIESGQVEWEEYTHFGIISRLAAGAANLPFLPMNRTEASQLQQANPEHRSVRDPYSNEWVVVVPALRPNVAIVHVQQADPNGNARVWGITGEQKEAALAARRVILTAEEIIPETMIRSDPNRTIIPAIAVDAVSHVPGGAHPSYAHGYYERDNAFYLDWGNLDSNGIAEYLDQWVFGQVDRKAYLQALGTDRWRGLAAAAQHSGAGVI